MAATEEILKQLSQAREMGTSAYVRQNISVSVDLPSRSSVSSFSAVLGMYREPTESSKQPIRARYLGHVTGYQPTSEQYFLNFGSVR